jgi:hypothetical protein
MARKGYRLPAQQEVSEAIKFLTWEQFPAIMEKSIRYFSVLPQVGVYKHFNSQIRSFDDALQSLTSRDYTISGVGSLINYDLYGNNIQRPSPQLEGTGCHGANSLCVEPTCFSLTEGVIESSNMLQNLCFSLSMPCLKDLLYSDRQFDLKMKRYFEAFFRQAPAVAQAYQRTRLLQEAVKIVATDKNFTFTGSLIGGATGQSLPFYMNPAAPTAFPDISSIGAGIGGLNLKAFSDYIAPRAFSGNFTGGMEGVRIYGLGQDYQMAKMQTATVMDSYMSMEILKTMQAMGMGSTADMIGSRLGEFVEDGMFPTFEVIGGQVTPITQEILEASTIAGFVQTSNPRHAMSNIRGLLFVPENWMFDLVEPPKDDFSYLGLGSGLDFASNTPGVHNVMMSSSMFSGNSIGAGGQVILGQSVGPNGMLMQSAKGLQKRDRSIREAVRTELLQTYSSMECNNAPDGQLHSVGSALMPQGRADGFKLKSTMYVGTDVKGTARPILLLFKTDTPRAAQAITVCKTVEVAVNQTAKAGIVSACPSNQIYTTLTYSSDISDLFTVDDVVAYRTGNKAATYKAKVTAVSGNVLTIESVDGTTILPACAGGQDDYGVRAEVINETEGTATCSEVIKATYDTGTGTLFIEVADGLAGSTAADTGTITLQDGSTINVVTVATALGVFIQLDEAAGETCNLANLDCTCLLRAQFCLTA